MAAKLSHGLDVHIQYNAPGLFQFYWAKRKEGIAPPLILVMMMLHYLPRFQKEPAITDWVQKITQKQPISFEQFIENNKTALSS